MADAATLATLIDLAQRRSDKAAEALAAAMRHAEEMASKLALLEGYRDEYLARLDGSARSGLSAGGLSNFRQFLARLEEAIAGQRALAGHAQSAVEARRGDWRGAERERKSYETLAKRAAAVQEKQAARREQKAMDEFAAAIFRRARAA